MAGTSRLEPATLADLVVLRDDIQDLDLLLEEDDLDDTLHAPAQRALMLLDDVIAKMSRNAPRGGAVQVSRTQRRVISSSVQLADALGYFVSQPPQNSILQRIH